MFYGYRCDSTFSLSLPLILSFILAFSILIQVESPGSWLLGGNKHEVGFLGGALSIYISGIKGKEIKLGRGRHWAAMHSQQKHHASFEPPGALKMGWPRRTVSQWDLPDGLVTVFRQVRGGDWISAKEIVKEGLWLRTACQWHCLQLGK